ncbi:chemotaxis protein CheW [Variovorax sp. AFSI2.2]|uniref:chemotaxis protein CheW n=1 Tax=Variovorax sp. AFSI2.2 TaxID=3384160 RepID=UPI003EB9A2DF
MNAAPMLAEGSAQAAIDDCWNRIGVQGDGTCPQLRQHVHCNRCPVHGAAALALLDREAPPDYLAECTRHMAQAPKAGQADVGSAIVFRIGTEWLALPTQVLLEVAALPPIHSLPGRRGGIVQGVANVRGELLVCVLLGSMLGLARVAEAGHGRQREVLRRLVVIGLDGQRLGFAVDEMHGIARFDPGTLKEVPATVARATAPYSKAILAWHGHSVGLLDEQLLFYTLHRSLA